MTLYPFNVSPSATDTNFERSELSIIYGAVLCNYGTKTIFEVYTVSTLNRIAKAQYLILKLCS